jgi:hypothetical protein
VTHNISSNVTSVDFSYVVSDSSADTDIVIPVCLSVDVAGICLEITYPPARPTLHPEFQIGCKTNSRDG